MFWLSLAAKNQSQLQLKVTLRDGNVNRRLEETDLTRRLAQTDINARFGYSAGLKCVFVCALLGRVFVY